MYNLGNARRNCPELRSKINFWFHGINYLIFFYSTARTNIGIKSLIHRMSLFFNLIPESDSLVLMKQTESIITVVGKWLSNISLILAVHWNLFTNRLRKRSYYRYDLRLVDLTRRKSTNVYYKDIHNLKFLETWLTIKWSQKYTDHIFISNIFWRLIIFLLSKLWWRHNL